MGFNPFHAVNKEEVRRRAEKLRKKHSNLSEREICDLIIKNKSQMCGLSGFITAFPATLPVIGTLVSLIGGTVVDIAAVSYFMAEMVLEMSVVYGRDLRLPGASREALWVIGSAVGTDAANKAIGKTAMKQMGNQAFVRAMQEMLLTLGIKATQRSVIRIIPFIGAVVCGLVNYFICRRVGLMAADYYEKNSYEQWTANAIDVDGEIID